MCYACDMCNRCGRYDRMKDNLGKRVCFSCGSEVPQKDARTCPHCGAQLPPPFPDPLPSVIREDKSEE